jgi:hypothetical protein
MPFRDLQSGLEQMAATLHRRIERDREAVAELGREAADLQRQIDGLDSDRPFVAVMWWFGAGLTVGVLIPLCWRWLSTRVGG